MNLLVEISSLKNIFLYIDLMTLSLKKENYDDYN